MSPDEIAQALATYTGLDIDRLERRLYPGGASRSGFLAPGERLGEVIHRDALTLRRLGVSRHALADRLEHIITGSLEPPHDVQPWTCELRMYRGHQEDPLHASSTFHLTRRGSLDFVIRRHGLLGPLRGPDLIVVLIRRACFFEGAVRYRIDPAKAARTLELLPGR